jgi:hypothetical protein
MNSKNLYWLGLALCVTLALSSCKKDEVSDPVIPNEEEVITTLNFTLSPVGGGTDIFMSFQDIDGDGPQVPEISVSDSLSANTEYTGSVLLLNETVTPADTINTEVLAEAEEHQFFYTIQGADMTVAYSDSDADGNPIGLSVLVETGSPSQGAITVVLRHEPDKTGAGVVAGDIANAGGETDIEATFDVVIE